MDFNELIRDPRVQITLVIIGVFLALFAMNKQGYITNIEMVSASISGFFFGLIAGWIYRSQKNWDEVFKKQHDIEHRIALKVEQQLGKINMRVNSLFENASNLQKLEMTIESLDKKILEYNNKGKDLEINLQASREILKELKLEQGKEKELNQKIDQLKGSTNKPNNKGNPFKK